MNNNILAEWAMIFDVLSNINRLKILTAIYQYKPQTIKELSELIAIKNGVTSTQLAKMNRLKLLKNTKTGINSKYSISNDKLLRIIQFIVQTEECENYEALVRVFKLFTLESRTITLIKISEHEDSTIDQLVEQTGLTTLEVAKTLTRLYQAGAVKRRTNQRKRHYRISHQMTHSIVEVIQTTITLN